jgi:hypothetical protein
MALANGEGSNEHPRELGRYPLLGPGGAGGWVGVGPEGAASLLTADRRQPIPGELVAAGGAPP